MQREAEQGNVLVTGGAGYVGSHACQALAERGFRPVVFDDLSSGHAWAVRWGPLEQGDLLDRGRLEEVLRRWRPRAVLHFAAQPLIARSLAEPALTWRINALGTETLLAAVAATAAIPLVLSSTCSLYGETAAERIDEAHPVRPINPYAESKLAAERAVAASGLPATVLRYFNAAGADPGGLIGEAHEPEPHLIPNALKAAAGRQAGLTVNGLDYPTADGSCVRDYVHVCDLARAHCLALERLLAGEAGAVLNLGSGVGASVLQVIAACETAVGRAIPYRVGPRRPGDPPRLVAEIAAAGRVLGWRPERSGLATVVADAWAWEQRRPL